MAGSGSIGKAYIQVVPTTKGIQGSVSKVLNKEAGDAGDKAGTEGGNRLTKALKRAVVVAGVGKFIGDAINAGADLQQSLGGIETLYKDSADKMKDYASKAYMTAGVSANDYMQQVTSYSASLISSMGGDVDAAADVANRAMIDMADNANKMGTPIENIQNAYQGFAKQNYTMLDNLKLGYGGTKTEMERLIKDAAAMTKEQKELGVTVDANSMSFENQINAISVMQQHLGITGTTADEAAKTISGSFGMMKAAYEDFLGNLALGNDITPQLENLITSVGYFGKNLVPALWNIVKAIPKVIIKIGPAVGKAIKEVFGNIDPGKAFESVLNAGEEIGPKLAKAMQKGAPALLKGMADLLSNLAKNITKYLPKMLEMGKNLVISMAKGLIQALPNIVSSIGQMFRTIMATLGALAPTIPAKLVELVNTLVALLYKNAPKILAAIGSIFKSILSGLAAFISSFLGSLRTNLVSVLKTLFNNIKSIASTAFRGIWNAIKAPFSNIGGWFRNAFSGAWNAIKGAFSGVGSFFGGIMQTIKSKFTGVGSAVGKAFKDTVTSGINAVIGVVEGAVNKAIRLINKALDLADKVVPGKHNWHINELSLPRLAQGAIVTRETAVIAGEGRYNEAVVPIDPFYKRMEKIVGNGGGDININVYGTSGMSVDELAEAVERKLIAAQNRRRLAWQ